MINTELILEVPAEKEMRLAIRSKTEEFFNKTKVLPPVTVEKLSDFASEVIKLNNWDFGLMAFVMVCCGNAIWQPVVRSVPFNRRILLLPRCMKNSKSCRGEEDELGLLCSACGSCQISGLLDIAENLGYLTVVSEGTTVTTKLIEEGKADAIIGVSCMDVLQKMYDSVTKYAVPGIGIPLLNSGCKDTKADIDWVRKEILAYDPEPEYRYFNLNYLRGKTAKIFNELNINKLLGLPVNITEHITYDYLLSGGKRLRPMLTVLACESFSGAVPDDDLARLALSIECFHKASLIHDDIEDNDSTRYGKEALHEKYGIPVAINAGDFLIGEGYRLITETSLPAYIKSECIGEAARGHRLLAAGQGMELMAVRNREVLTTDKVIEIFDYKASTAFRVALLTGAIAGGADEKSISLLSQFSHYIGIAYQIMDDIEDFTGPDGSIDLNKPSVFLSLLNEKMDEAERVLFMGAYFSNDANAIKQFCVRYHIEAVALELFDKYMTLTRSCLEDFSNPGLKLTLHEILGKIFNKHI